jgi:hypothetical protein
LPLERRPCQLLPERQVQRPWRPEQASPQVRQQPEQERQALPLGLLPRALLGQALLGQVLPEQVQRPPVLLEPGLRQEPLEQRQVRLEQEFVREQRRTPPSAARRSGSKWFSR